MAGESQLRQMRPEDYAGLSRDELIQRALWSENERAKVLSEEDHAMKDVTRRMQMHLAEIRSLKEANEKVSKESLELRDLCCFLDDDRQKGRKLAREWQKFGRYSSGYMHTEVSNYQDKLKELEEHQKKLIQENAELKELCVLLDDERTSKRSSICSNCSGALDELGNKLTENGPINPQDRSRDGYKSNRSSMDDATRAYVQRLEDRVHFLEEEKRQRTMPRRSNGPMRDDRMQNHVGGPPRPSSVPPPPYQRSHGLPPQAPPRSYDGTVTPTNNRNPHPDMVNALKVVWRKLGDNPSGSNRSTPALQPSSSRQGQSHQRYSTGSSGPPPIRQGGGMSGQPRPASSTSSLDRKGF
ncbi:coiled-coil domain-containing protein 85C-A-like isoform X2 [Apostichopus japonicus]|uniref:coiled-coil domain-containing protein 85C-A-like isoform X2 n=1 Tax=Stichopus japonicus TaxID=307972 RepID=UPI003AB3BA59